MRTDLLLVGGGLANCLIAKRLLDGHPDLDLLVVERGPTLGGAHTWSFHDSDLIGEQRRWMEPLIVRSWPRHELRFPRRHRVMEGGYNTVSSERLHEVIHPKLGDRAMLGVEVTEVRADGITLSDGRTIHARSVIDGRGDPGGGHLDIAFQKFLGLFVRLDAAHDLDDPILMDATVPQTDGYRFVYTLPFSPTELLIEDTYYADRPDLDEEALHRGILDYAADRGWEIGSVTATERGVLPIVLGGDIEAFWNEGPAGVARSGMRGAFFQPTTGYSLPEAVRLAFRIETTEPVGGHDLYEMTRTRSRRLWADTAYFRLLNRMLFRAADPELRYRVFERFYGLSEGLIRRFYAGRLKWTDKLRVLTGKPPVPVHRALSCLFERPIATAKRPIHNGRTP